jgi:ribonuclease HI
MMLNNILKVDNIIENMETYFSLEDIKKMKVKIDSILQNDTKKVEKIQKSLNINKSEEKTYVWTDGSCYNKSKAGYGIFFSDNNPLNVSSPLELDKKTNNTAELKAILECLRILDKNNYHNSVIISDSKYCINSVTKWYKKWRDNGWKKSDGKLVQNLDLIKEIISLNSKLTVTYEHINSHTKEPNDKTTFEYKKWYGNEMADRLAKEGSSNC